MRGRRHPGAIAVAHLQPGSVHTFVEVSEKDLDDFGDKLIARIIVVGKLPDSPHVDRWNARCICVHSID
jgi:hypothetical protein